MRAELCHFSGLKIYPGHGISSIRADGKAIRLLSSKTRALYHDKKNPRKLRWTLLYRRKNKKGVSNEASLKRRVRRNVKAAKAVAGLSYNELLAKKQQKPEIRQKQRDNAIKAAKEKKKAAEANKAAARKAMPKSASKQAAKMPMKQKMKGAGGKR
jgi:large subunit ribosomal protein L24e